MKSEFTQTFEGEGAENPIAGAVIFHEGKIIVCGSITAAMQQARNLQGTALVVGQCQEAVSDSSAQAVAALNITEFNDGVYVAGAPFQSQTHLCEVRSVSCRFCTANTKDTVQTLVWAGWSIEPRGQICPDHNNEDFLSNLV